MMMRIKQQSEIRMHPIDDPTKITVVLSRADLQRLKMAAAELNTTVNEIMRALASDWLDEQAAQAAQAEKFEKKELPHM